MPSYPRIPLGFREKFGNKKYWIIGLASVAFFVVWLLPLQPVGAGLTGYAPLHTILESFAIVISGVIFTIGWHARLARESDVLALLAVGFLGVGLLDVAHLLSFEDMPEWFTPSSSNKAISFWLLSRYLAAFTLLAFVVGASQRKSRRGTDWIALVVMLAFVLTASWAVLSKPEWLPVFFVPGSGLTQTKVSLEWLLVVIVFGTLLLVWRQKKKVALYDSGSLMAALWLTCLSELCFTLYSNAADVFNLMGHVYKVLSYGFLYNAIVIGSVKLPYQLLSESRETLQQLTDNIRQVFWMTSPDKKTMLYISPAYETIWQRQCSSVIESPMTWLDAIHPDDLDRVNQYLEQQDREEGVIDYRIIRPDGSIRHIRSRSFPIRDELGNALRIAGVAEDVTDAIVANEALQRKERLLQQTQSIAHLGSWEFDLEKNLITWSDEVYRIFGASADEFASTYEALMEMVHPDDLKYVEDSYQASLLPGINRYEFEHRIIRKSNQDVRYVREQYFHRRDDKGRVIQSVGLVHDITDQKQAENEQQKLLAQLVQAQKMEAIGHLTGGIAHDFNNMLGAILGYAYLLGLFTEENIDINLQKSYVDEILIAGNRAKELIAQMLIFSRLRPESEDATAPTVMLQPIVKEIMQLLRISFPSTIDVSYQLESEDLKVRVQPVQLHQILMNLAINARDASSSGYGRIELRVDKRETSGICSSCHEYFDGEYVVLNVMDKGDGITEEILSKIFDPFFTTKEVGKGSGMGLSVVHGMVHTHGGHVVATSDPDQGTSFQILLIPAPEVSEGPEKTDTNLTYRTDDSIFKELSIMVVDDEQSIAMMLQQLLEIHGAQVIRFSDPEQALTAFKNDPHAIDLVITDETMPKLSGLDMSRIMLEQRPDLLVFLCTGYSDTLNDDVVKKYGITKLLYKPVHHEKLIEEIAELTRRQV